MPRALKEGQTVGVKKCFKFGGGGTSLDGMEKCCQQGGYMPSSKPGLNISLFMRHKFSYRFCIKVFTAFS